MSEIADTSRLGRLVSRHEKSSAHVGEVVPWALLSGAFAAFFFVGASTFDDWLRRIVMSVPGLLFMLPVAAAVWVLLKSRGAVITLYENGFEYASARQKFSTTWDDIESYYWETACRIVKRDGETLEFGANIERVGVVAQRIEAETLNRMLPRARASIEAGKSVEFRGLKLLDKVPLGKVVANVARAFSGFTVDADGIATIDGGERFAWDEVTSYGVAEEPIGRRQVAAVFFVSREDEVLRTRLALLSNAHVLLALCEELIPADSDADSDTDEY
jgi:hypothetical protein